MKIVAIRHLPTQANVDGLLQGRRDDKILPLSAKNARMIEANLDQLRVLMPFDKVLVSTLRRSSMTADCYGYEDEKEIEPLLDELDFGVHEGKPRSDMVSLLGDRWFATPEKLILGEPLANLRLRVEQLLAEYQHMNSLLVFGHAAWIRAMICFVTQGDIINMNHFQVAHNDPRILNYQD